MRHPAGVSNPRDEGSSKTRAQANCVLSSAYARASYRSCRSGMSPPRIGAIDSGLRLRGLPMAATV